MSIQKKLVLYFGIIKFIINDLLTKGFTKNIINSINLYSIIITSKKSIYGPLTILLCFQYWFGVAQIDTISFYNTLNECTNISAEDYPVQIARIIPDRAGKLTSFTLYTDGNMTGSCRIIVLGHEGGNNLPSLRNSLIEPITTDKTKIGFEAIDVQLPQPIFINNYQFYIVLDKFTGNFGLKQDATYEQEFCVSKDGGNYYPTLLMNKEKKWTGDNCNLAIDICLEYEPKKPPIFVDVTKDVNIPLNFFNHSIAWGDIDQDNWLDLLVGSTLYKNRQGTFQNQSKKLDAYHKKSYNAMTFIDMDNDGDLDLLFLGREKSILNLNDGKGDFKSQTLELPPLPSLSAYSIADINKDKYPDIVLAQLWQKYPVPMPNYLFLNNQSLDFSDVTKRLYRKHKGTFNYSKGIVCEEDAPDTHIPNKNKNRRSRGTQFTDFDLDGDVDLYITNYFLETDEFYRNNGKGRFKKIATPKAFEQAKKTDNHGTGVDWYDFDNDGDFDLLLPQLAHPRFMKPHDHRGTTLFRNDDGKFTDLINSHGIQYEETHAGAGFGDINNDGLVDIITTVYYGCRYVGLYLQQPDHRFKLQTFDSGLEGLTTGIDVCFVDYNNDGLLDVSIGNKDKFRLYKNILKNDHAWLKIQVVSKSYNHFGIGAIVKVYANGQVYTQEISSGRGQRMQKPTVLHFGLGKANIIDKIEVHWGKKHIDVFTDISIKQMYTLFEDGEKVLVK